LKVIDDILKVLEQLEIDYWVTNGTLLGLTRDKKLLPWDDDFDIDISSKIFKKNVALLASTFIKMGFIVKIKLNGPFIGMNIFHKNLKCSLGGQINFFEYFFDYNNKYPRNLIFPIKTFEYLGINLKFPSKPENLCEYIYKSWKIEIRSSDQSDYMNKELQNSLLVKTCLRILIVMMHFYTMWKINSIKFKISSLLR
jgi:hypothetical protein